MKDLRDLKDFDYTRCTTADPPTPTLSAHFKVGVYATTARKILKEKSFNLKTPRNEVHCTNAVPLPIKIMLCCKLRRQRVLD